MSRDVDLKSYGEEVADLLATNPSHARFPRHKILADWIFSPQTVDCAGFLAVRP